jgi:hypothetical protein
MMKFSIRPDYRARNLPAIYLSIITLFTFTACVSQRDIEIACLKTLSASTPICSCNQTSNNPKVEKTVQPLPQTLPQNPSVVENTPVPASPDIKGKLIFSADFESGNLSAFKTADAEALGKGVFFQQGIVNSPAIGKSAASLTIGSGDTTASYLFVYKVPSTPLGVYSADFYIPGSIMPGDWWNIWQWKSEDNAFNKPVININLARHGSQLTANLFYTPGGMGDNDSQEIIQSNPIPFPIDQWVNITGFYFARNDNTGYVEIYQDGTKIFDIRDIQTLPGNEKVFWSVNSYADRIAPNPATIYVDNIRIFESK